LTVLPIWGNITAFTATTAQEYPANRPTERDPTVERVSGNGPGEDGATSGPGDGGGPLPATEGEEEPATGRLEFGWHHEASALSSQTRG